MILKFGIVGSVGFLVETAIILFIKNEYPALFLYSRAFSFPPAVLATWLLNRVWTFSSDGSKGKEFARYFIVQSIGAGINFFVYYVLLATFIVFYEFPVLALAVASGVAMIFNYFASKVFVFAVGHRGSSL